MPAHKNNVQFRSHEGGPIQGNGRRRIATVAPILRLATALILGGCGLLTSNIVIADPVQGRDGVYATTDNNYQINVKFSDGKLTVVEPNKTSNYIQRSGSGIYEFTNPTNGISYVLEVTEGGNGLKAYKPGSPQNFTPLKLLKAAAPATPAVGVVRIPVQNETAVNPNKSELWGIRKIPALKVEGVYAIEGEVHPVARLESDGTGIFEMYGAPNPEHVYAIKWWIQCNIDGTPLVTDYPAAEQYQLIVEYVDKPYQGLRFNRLALNVQKSSNGRMFILDRSKLKVR